MRKAYVHVTHLIISFSKAVILYPLSCVKYVRIIISLIFPSGIILMRLDNLDHIHSHTKPKATLTLRSGIGFRLDTDFYCLVTSLTYQHPSTSMVLWKLLGMIDLTFALWSTYPILLSASQEMLISIVFLVLLQVLFP